jgi:hypothetical protein
LPTALARAFSTRRISDIEPTTVTASAGQPVATAGTVEPDTFSSFVEIRLYIRAIG